MRCKCGGLIVVSHNQVYGSCGFCLECNKWFEKNDLEIIMVKEKDLEVLK